MPSGLWSCGWSAGDFAHTSETSNVSTGGSPILKATRAPHIPKAGSAPFGFATNFFFRKAREFFPKTHGLLVVNSKRRSPWIRL
jgi:hypothetical protein